MLIPSPRVLCLRPVASAAAAASILNAGAASSTPSLLPSLARAQDCRLPPAVGSSPCVCCAPPQPPTQQRCYRHHRPAACASAVSTSRPASGPRTQPFQYPPAPFPLSPNSTYPVPLRKAASPGLPSSSAFCCASSSSSPSYVVNPSSRPSFSSSSSSSSSPFSPNGAKRRRTATHATPTAASGAAAPHSDAAAAATAATTDVAAGDPSRRAPALAAARPPADSPAASAAALPEPLPLLTSGLGQVIASASNYVRVEVYQLLPDQEPTPQDWRPPHLRPRPPPAPAAAPEQPTAAATAATSGHGGGVPSPAAPPEPAHPRLLLCSVRALLRKLRQEVVVGDVVRVGSIDWRQGRGVVSEVLPRSSRLLDPSVANVDHVLLVFALDQPPFEEYQVSRFLVAAEAAGLPFSLLLNKADLVGPEQLSRRLAQCRRWGYEPIVLSCERGEGVEQVAEVIQGRISVVAGPSGAGKSSLINSLRLGRHRPDLRDSTDPRVSGTPADLRNLPPGGAADLIELPPLVVRAYGDGAAASASPPDGCEAGEGASWAAEGSASGEEEEEAEGEEGEAEAGGQLPRARARSARGGGGGGGSAAAATKSDPAAAAAAPEFLAVGSLSKIGRGMHTTTAVTLLRLLGGGWLADTPGFGQPTLEDIPSPLLARCFPDLSALLATCPCRFADCRHLAEPGCAVREAGLERYSHYLRFLQEIRAREASDVRQLQRAKAEREGATKAKSVRGGGERQEARLDPRRHRRQSRQSARWAGQREEEELLG